MSARDLILQRINDRGPITVAEFMALALYHPTHGYYARSDRRTGRRGDFYTSVDVGPLFGALLCRQFAEMWRVVRGAESGTQATGHAGYAGDSGFDLVEAGASNGQLARDILEAAEVDDPEFYAAIRLHLIEASPAARSRQRSTLGHHAEKLVRSSSRLPPSVHGAIYANELLDALPVHRVVMTEAGLRESYVDASQGLLVERLGELSTPAIARHLTSLGVVLEPGWCTEVNLSALSWMVRACLSLHLGFLLLIDYGHEAQELHSGTHASGTLTTFSRHVHEDLRGAGSAPWLVDPGDRDITSHVDLTAIQRTAEDLGYRTLGLLDQTYFLLALAGSDPTSWPTLGRDLGAEGASPSLPSDTRRNLAMKTLLWPGGLGSTHKVMAFGKNVGAPPLLGLSGLSRLT